ncbi:cytochrome P450 family protein [Rhizoctonia solani]|uniref:Cytochrome P450 family protein n=1 Tax=Rhizoctonia solani TaxID=456999 RepID=A0A8H8SUJ6_9AGAM|nr:cytochrome P450 family protein [Rhizoctonia solani]QRW18329.1 cytochrome P450 family protein [Rhizoctonia solani]
MFTEQTHLTTTQYGLTAGALLLAYYLVPYLLDPHDYRRRFSGPLAASLSNWWLSNSTQSGRHSEIIHELHEKYGKFVRIGPNHISIADPNALDASISKLFYGIRHDANKEPTSQAVYGHSNGLLKSEFYEAFKADPNGNVFNIRDKAVHTMKRKRIANIFSAQNVQAFEPRVRSHVEKFCSQLDIRCEEALKGVSGFNWDAKDGRVVLNMCPQFSYIAFDIITQKDSIPAALSLISNKKVADLPVIHMIAQGTIGAVALAPHPPLLQKILLFGAPWHIPDLIARRDFVEVTKAAVNTRISKVENGTIDNENREEIDAEALVTIGAGSDTTSNSLGALCYYIASHPQVKKTLQEEPLLTRSLYSSLGALCYYIASHPQVKKTLQEELDSVHASADQGEPELAYGLASFEQVKNLPYLNACIKEALLAGETFNEGSIISVPSYSTNRSNVWGTDPEVYRPERWLDGGSEALNKYYVPFSTGPRACVGRNLANMNMILISATFFHRYDVELATPTTQFEVKEGFVREAVKCNVAIKRRV